MENLVQAIKECNPAKVLSILRESLDKDFTISITSTNDKFEIRISKEYEETSN